MTRKREDHMDVARWEKLLATCCEPAIASSCLTLRAVSISTGIVGDGAMSAASALIEMSAERGGATPRNGQEHFDVLPGDPLTASFDEGVSRSADQIGHLEGWPVHLLVLWWLVFQLQRVQRTPGGTEVTFREMEVDSSFFQIAMP
jgi:hypothetical protein